MATLYHNGGQYGTVSYLAAAPAAAVGVLSAARGRQEASAPADRRRLAPRDPESPRRGLEGGRFNLINLAQALQHDCRI